MLITPLDRTIPTAPLLCAGLLVACTPRADLGDVPRETEGLTEAGSPDIFDTEGDTEGDESSGTWQGPGETDPNPDTGATEVTGGCERIAADPEDPHSWAFICGLSGTTASVGAMERMTSGDLVVGVRASLGPAALAEGAQPTWEVGDARYRQRGPSDVILLGLDPTGELVWSQHFASGFEDHLNLRGLASCADGFVMAAGTQGEQTDGSVDYTFGEGEFIARFGPDGALLWTRTFDAQEPDGHVSSVDIHCDAAGNVAISGTARDGVDFGDGMLPAAVSDAFVAKFDTDGELLFAKTLLADSDANGSAAARAMAVVAHDDGTTYVFLDHTAAVDFGAGPIEPLNDFVGAQSLLARLSEAGDLLWTAPIGGQGPVYARDLQIDADGGAAVSGPFLSFVDLGGSTFGNVFPYEEQNPKSDGTNYDAYLAVFEADGTYAWGEALGWMEDEDASLGPFAGGNAEVYRVSDFQQSLRVHSADGSGDLLGTEFDGANAGRALNIMRASDSAVLLGGSVDDELSWPFDVGPHLNSGTREALVVHFDR